MRRVKALAGGALFLLGTALAVAVWLLLGETNVDRDDPGYRSRMQRIWTGPPPGSPDLEPVPTDLDSGLLRHFFRNVAAVTMDLDDVETIDFFALGGADSIVVNDLSGTDLVQANLDLAFSSGSRLSVGWSKPMTAS